MPVPDAVKAAMSSCGAYLPDTVVDSYVPIAQSLMTNMCTDTPTEEAVYAYAVILLLPPSVAASCGALWAIVAAGCPGFISNNITF